MKKFMYRLVSGMEGTFISEDNPAQEGFPTSPPSHIAILDDNENWVFINNIELIREIKKCVVE